MEKMMGAGMATQPTGDTGPSSQAFNGITARMQQETAITFTGNADIDFVKEMIPLHQGAVDMAKTVLAFGKDPEIKKAAEEAIKTQEAEIAWMKEWLKKQAQYKSSCCPRALRRARVGLLSVASVKPCKS